MAVVNLRLVRSAEVIPTPMGVATARSGDAKIACGKTKDHGMMKDKTRNSEMRHLNIAKCQEIVRGRGTEGVVNITTVPKRG